MTKLEYMNDHESLEKEDTDTVIEFLNKNKNNIERIQEYIKKAPQIKAVDSQAQAHFSASLVIESSDYNIQHTDLLLTIYADTLYIEETSNCDGEDCTNSTTIASVEWD
jgi:hypothetical protein